MIRSSENELVNLIRSSTTGRPTVVTNMGVKTDANNVGELDQHADELLWELAMRQDQHMIDQFGLSIVGIGALFFAYGSISTPTLKLMVAAIGFAASIVLANHVHGSRREFYALRGEPRERNPDFFQRYDRVAVWRDQGVGRLYDSASRLMLFFLIGVSLAWVAIFVYRLSQALVSETLFWRPGVFPGLEQVYQVLFIICGSIFLIVVVRILQGKRSYRRKVEDELQTARKRKQRWNAAHSSSP